MASRKNVSAQEANAEVISEEAINATLSEMSSVIDQIEALANEQTEVKVEATPEVNVPTAEQRTAIDTSIRTKFAQYFEGKQSAHLAAVEAVMWAAKYGDAHYINVAFDLCGGFLERPAADAENLRVWCGIVSKYTNAAGKDVNWLGFNAKATDTKKAGFFVKSGLEPKAAREAMNELSLTQGPRFMDRLAKASKPLSMDDILRLITKFPETVVKKEQKVIESGNEGGPGAVPLPDSLKKKLLEAAAEATSAMASHKAA